MFCSRRFVSSAIALALVAFSPVRGKEAECPNAPTDPEYSEALLQKAQRISPHTVVEEGSSDAAVLLNDAMQKRSAGLPAHIVCHTESCAEVQASLTVIKGKQQVAQRKLAECSKTRKQLQSDLAAAAAKRAKAEQGLAKCAAERAALEKELRQCAEVDRPNAERALAECARDRAKLEAELRQCAEVDRPAAEKGLAQCAKDRAELEARLKKLASGMKGGAASKSARRRRRRRSKASLLTDGSVASDSNAELTEDSQLDDESQDVSLGTEEELLMQGADDIESEFDDIDKRAEEFQKKLDAVDARESEVSKGMAANEAKDGKVQADLKNAEDKAVKILSDMEKVSNDLTSAEEEVEQATEAAEKVGNDLAGQQNLETAALLELAALMQEEHQVLHSHLQEQHEGHAERLKKHEDVLKGKADKDCSEARAEIVTAKGKLELTDSALQACLSAKKEIQAKIDNVVALGDTAAEGLRKCLDTKAELKIKIKQCHDRRDLARQKLKECLDRKKVLKQQIDSCHAKRDEARQKLKACLARKADLKAKISKLTKRSSLIQDASPSEQELVQIHKQHEEAKSEMSSLLSTLRVENEQFEHVVSALQELSDEEIQHVDGMSQANEDSDAASNDIKEAEQEEMESEKLSSGMATQLSAAIAALKQLAAQIDGATQANEASGQQVDKVESSVSLLMEKGI